ncbi:MAG TPA: nickel insertion protein, partial [Acidimicrobiales bacterium]|nr:nickel insertion protein [Acidimicrobiales bacterium]
MLKAWGSLFGPMPEMTVEASGYGAGAREIDGMPNCTQVLLGTLAPAAPSVSPERARPLLLVETNVDDATGETLAHAVEKLMAEGALDAWITPVVMKKGRPAHVVSVLADPALAPRLSAVLRAETGSLGTRAHEVSRWGSSRDEAEVVVEDLPIRVKVSPGRVKAEHEDVVRVARQLGRPVVEIAARAEAEWLTRSDGPTPTNRRLGAGRDDAPPAPPGRRHQHPAGSGPAAGTEPDGRGPEDSPA